MVRPVASQNRQNYVSHSVKSFDPNDHLNFEQQEVVSMAGSVCLSTAEQNSSQQLPCSAETAAAPGFNTTANAGQHSIISQLLATQTSPSQQQQQQQQQV